MMIVKEENQIEKYIGKWHELEKCGTSYFRSNCFFCEDKGKRFIITPAKQTFYCFKCKVGGDLIEFVSKYRKISVDDAISFITSEIPLGFKV